MERLTGRGGPCVGLTGETCGREEWLDREAGHPGTEGGTASCGRNPELTWPGIAQVLVRCVELCFAAELRQHLAPGFSLGLKPRT